MKEIINIIKKLRNTPSTKEKENILKNNKDNELLKTVLEYTYNPYKKYGISEKTIKPIKDLTVYDYDVFELLYMLEKSNINDKLRSIVNSFLGNIIDDPDLFDLYKCMILKDLRCNISSKTINKVFKNLIPAFDVMLASKYFDCQDKVKGEFIITTKLDGIRCVGFKENGLVKFYSRQGQLIEGLIEIENAFKSIPEGVVLDGELLLRNDKNLPSAELYRETVKVVRKDGVKNNIEFHVFDILSLESFKQGVCKIPCIERKQALKNLVRDINSEVLVEVPMLYVGSNKDKIIELLNEAIKNDFEGVMVNLSGGVYECKRSKVILKVKKFNDMDLKVISIEEGEGKNKGNLGRINVQFKNNVVGVGSGFSDEMRREVYDNPDKYIGKIAKIQYFEITNNSKDNKESLRFPVFVEWRFDKDEPSYN